MNPNKTIPPNTPDTPEISFPSPKPVSLADHLMAVEVFSELLASTDPNQLGQKLTEQLRELTGAKTVLLLTHAEGSDTHQLIHACPPRRAELFSQVELDYFCPILSPELLPHRSEHFPEDHPLRRPLLREGVKSLLRFPLHAAGEWVGTLLLLDLPGLDLIDGTVEIVTSLAPVMALALKNSFSHRRIEQQAEELALHAQELEQRVAERTADLESANRTLADSRQNALNMMAEAVKARQQAEETTIALQWEIAERLRAEQSLGEIETKQRAMIANISDVIAIVDRDGINRYESPNIEGLFGWSPSEVVGLPVWGHVHPDDQERIKNRFVTLLAEPNQSQTSECRYQCKDGHYKWIHFTALNLLQNPDIGGILLNFHDITEQRDSQQLLAQEKERLAVTLRSIGDGVITTDTHGHIILFNRAAEQLTGWKAEEALGQPLPHVFHIFNELTRQPCENPVEKVLKTGSNVELANHTCLLAKDGREMIIADSGAPIRDNQSRIIGVVLVFRDMTEKQKLTDSLQREQKLQSIGVLAGGIAHDFNNLLGGIFGYLEMANENISIGNSEKTIKYISKALTVFDRAKALTQQLLTFSQGGAPVSKTIQIAPLIRNSTQFALSGSNVSCLFDLSDDLWPCDCDENQIGQVIDNIIINAKQAMPMGGIIRVSAKNVSIEPGNRGSSPYRGNFVAVSIKDQGIGIPKEMLAHIFDPFFSTKESGHGLGLATVFSIVQRHDGWLNVESEPGKGSTFHFYLPASRKAGKTPTIPLPIEHKGTGTILILDDEIFMLDIVANMLENMGYQVVQCKDGADALMLFSQAETTGSEPFKACILDLTIPGGIGGRETAIALRKIKEDAILIAASGYSEDPIMAKPMEHHFTDRIVKPFRKKELAELLNKLFPDHPTT